MTKNSKSATGFINWRSLGKHRNTWINKFLRYTVCLLSIRRTRRPLRQFPSSFSSATCHSFSILSQNGLKCQLRWKVTWNDSLPTKQRRCYSPHSQPAQQIHIQQMHATGTKSYIRILDQPYYLVFIDTLKEKRQLACLISINSCPTLNYQQNKMVACKLQHRWACLSCML